MNETAMERVQRVAPGEDVSVRVDLIELAHRLGCTDAVFADLARAPRACSGDTIVIPAGDYGSLYGSKEWARKGSGKDAEWGTRVPGGWRVGAGHWLVESRCDSRKKRDSLEWDVRHVIVGEQVWTVAF